VSTVVRQFVRTELSFKCQWYHEDADSYLHSLDFETAV
jgi:hypothetical protein